MALETKSGITYLHRINKEKEFANVTYESSAIVISRLGMVSLSLFLLMLRVDDTFCTMPITSERREDERPH